MTTVLCKIASIIFFANNFNRWFLEPGDVYTDEREPGNEIDQVDFAQDEVSYFPQEYEQAETSRKELELYYIAYIDNP